MPRDRRIPASILVGRVLVFLLVAGAVTVYALVPRNRNDLILPGCAAMILVCLFVRRLESLRGVSAGPLRRSIRTRAALLGFAAFFMMLCFVMDAITSFHGVTGYAEKTAPNNEAFEHRTAEQAGGGGSAARPGGSL